MNLDSAVLDMVSVPIFVLAVDDRGTPRYCHFNKAATELSGFSAEQVDGRTAQQVFGGSHGDIAFGHHVAVVQDCTRRSYQIDSQTEIGPQRISTTLIPELDSRGRVQRILGTCENMTSLKHAEQNLQSLRTITHEIEDFVAMAAHDLRTPMRNVQQLVDLVLDGFSDLGDGKIEMIKMLGEIATQSADLINDVLAYAHATSATPSHQQFDLGALCNSLQQVLNPSNLHSVSWPNVAIKTDETALQIILRNLIDNAIKHCGAQCCEIQVSVRQSLEGWLEIAIADNGTGFSEPAKVFLNSKKFRVDSGYGLFGIKRLIAARGGSIRAENKSDGRGARVIVTLPGTVMDAPIQAGTTAQDKTPEFHRGISAQLAGPIRAVTR